MKKILVLTIAFIVIPLLLFGQSTIVVAKKKAGGSVLKDSSSASANASRYFGYNSVVGASGPFTSGSAYTLTSFKLYTSKAGTGGSCTVTGYIYNNSSGSPGSAIGTSTNTHTGAEFGSQLEWTFEGVSISNATAYWIVLLANSSSCGSAGNYPNFIYNNAGSLAVKFWDGSTWTNTDDSADFNFETYGY